MAKRYVLGRFLAEVQIDTDRHDVVVVQTSNDPSHHSVIATPITLRSLVFGTPVPIL